MIRPVLPPLRVAGIATLLALASPACGPGSGLPHAPPEAPNVLLITIDTLRADRLGAYGYPRPTTPALDRLAIRSVVFERATASAPWTLPALASALTSESVSTHGCWSFGSVLDESFVTLGEHLLAAGYDTACVTSHLFTTTRHGLQQGVVHSDDSFAYPEVDPSQNVTSQVISDKGIRFLDQKRASPDGGPWFLWLHYFDPHEEYMPHPGLSEAFVTPGERTPAQVLGDLYDGEIRYTDQHIERVLQSLEENGFAGNTVVCVLSDHGEEFFEHGGQGHGHSLYQELLHVPLIVHVPELSARRVPQVVRQIDLLPTLLELVGLPVPGGLAGRSLVPLLKGGALDEAPALSEVDHGLYSLEALQLGRFKLIHERKLDRYALYDLELDPGEQQDVGEEHPEQRMALRDQLERLRNAALERAAIFGTHRELTLTPGLGDSLDALGYGGSGSAVERDDSGEPKEGGR